MGELLALLVLLLTAFLVVRVFRRHRGIFEREWLVVAAFWLLLAAIVLMATFMLWVLN